MRLAGYTIRPLPNGLYHVRCLASGTQGTFNRDGSRRSYPTEVPAPVVDAIRFGWANEALAELSALAEVTA